MKRKVAGQASGVLFQDTSEAGTRQLSLPTLTHILSLVSSTTGGMTVTVPDRISGTIVRTAVDITGTVRMEDHTGEAMGGAVAGGVMAVVVEIVIASRVRNRHTSG